MSIQIPVEIHNLQNKVRIPVSLIRDIVSKTLSRCYRGKGEYQVNVIFVDNRYIRKLNKQYLKKDSSTDVISFCMHEEVLLSKDQTPVVLLGDIFISAQKAKQQASEYAHTIQKELTILTIHGVLHLLGYDHIKKTDARVMKPLEEDILSIVTSKKK